MGLTMRKNLLIHLIIISFTVTWIVGSVFYYGMYERMLRDGGDAWGYYIYLPSAFVSHDITTLSHVGEIRKKYNPWIEEKKVTEGWIQEVHNAPNGNPVIKYTSGVALMLSPFFLIAHALALSFGLEANGFGPVYWLSAYLGVIAWVFLGLVVLYRTMIRYFDPRIVLGSLVMIVLGSNLYYFLSYNSPMSHAPLFALYALLIGVTDRFYRNPRWDLALWTGLICGGITMIRPVEVICILVPLFWGIKGISDRFRFLKSNGKLLLVALAGFFLSIFPQLLYWKVVTGQWIYYSYGGEGFDFRHPRILEGLTGFMNGWLVYTPMFLLAIPGMLVLYRRHRGIFIPVTLLVLLHVYIVFSWHNWYYINSFGSRPMVDLYALLAFPLAGGIQWLGVGWRKYLLIPVCLFFVALNQFQTWQVSRGMLSSEEGNPAYYQALFGRTRMTEKILIASDTQILQPDREDLDSLGMIWNNTKEISESETGFYLLPPGTDVAMEVILDSLPVQVGDYLRISADAMATGWSNGRWGMAMITSYFRRNEVNYWWRWVRIHNKLGNPTWNLFGGQPDVRGEAWYYYRIPEEYQEGDPLHVFLSNNSLSGVHIYGLRIEHWRKKTS